MPHFIFHLARHTVRNVVPQYSTRTLTHTHLWPLCIKGQKQTCADGEKKGASWIECIGKEICIVILSWMLTLLFVDGLP